MDRIKLFFRTTFIGGFLVVLPIVILLFVLNWLFETITNNVRPLTNLIVQTVKLNEFVSISISIAILVTIFFIVGLFVRTEMGKVSFQSFEQKFLRRIFGYKIIKETVSQIFSEDKSIFKAVALVKLFGNETKMTAFVTDEYADGSYTVFIPSGPAPTAGFVYHVKREQIEIVDVSVEQAFRTILSLGAGSKKLFGNHFPGKDNT